MSEKIIITVEQNEALKTYVKYENGMQDFVEERSAWIHQYKSLKEFTVDQMARILYEPNSYEVEPKFKIDDWVVYTHDNSLWKIAGELYGGKIHYEITKIGKHKGSVHKDHIRHATKEEIFWAELGREVCEFKIGDVTLTINDTAYFLENDECVLAEKDEYNNGRLKGFYPAESFIKIPL